VIQKQYHTPSKLREKWATVTGCPVIDFDGYAEITFSSMESLMEAFQDPYHINVVRPDEDKFWDKEATRNIAFTGIMQMTGVVREIVKNGKGVI